MALSTGLIAYWKLDESSGNAADSFSTNTLTNANVTYQAGKINNGALFNSTTDALSTTTYTPFDFERTDTFSFNFWVNLTAVGNNQFFISHQDSGGADYIGYSIYQGSSGTVNFDFYHAATGPNALAVKTATSQLGTGWHMITMTYDGSSSPSGCHIYVDAVDKTLTTVANNLTLTTKNTNPFVLGNRGNGFNMNGMLDEVGVWNRVLTSSESTTLYNGGAGLPYSSILGATNSGFLGLM